MNKKHPIDQERLQAYLDRELTREESKIVENHLVECQECEREVARLRMLFQEIESVPVADLHRDLAPKVLEAIRARESISLRIRVIPVLQAISAALLLGVLWPMMRTSLSRLSASWSIWNVEEWLLDGLLSIQTVLTAVADQVGIWLDNLLQGVDFNFPIWPISVWWIVLAGGFGIWLLGNGYLLTHFERRSNGE